MWGQDIKPVPCLIRPDSRRRSSMESKQSAESRPTSYGAGAGIIRIGQSETIPDALMTALTYKNRSRRDY